LGGCVVFNFSKEITIILIYLHVYYSHTYAVCTESLAENFSAALELPKKINLAKTQAELLR